MTRIKLKINNKGEINANYEGFVGKNCDIAEKKLKEIIDNTMKIKTKNQRYKDRQFEEEKQHA